MGERLGESKTSVTKNTSKYAKSRLSPANLALSVWLIVTCGSVSTSSEAVEPAGGAPTRSADRGRDAPAIADGYVDVSSGRLFYEEAGKGPVLVLLHDGLLHREVWDGQFREFAKTYRVIRYDRRGYGRSTPQPAQGYSNIADLHALLKALRVDRATMVG